MLIRRKAEGSHWYLKNGTPFYEVPMTTKEGMRPVNITDAFKAGAYRSVTNVLSVVAKPGLVEWRIEQAVLAALTLPRREAETDHYYAERVIEDAEAQAEQAAQLGTRIHELAANYLTKKLLPDNEPERQLLGPFFAWADKNVKTCIASETVILNHSLAYAGRLDAAVELFDGSIALVDLKSQDVKTDRKGNPTPAFHDEWALQLGAYSRGQFADGSYPPPFPWRLLSVVIDRNRPGCWPKEWTDPNNVLASSEPHFQGFAAACRLWTYIKGGTPGIDLRKAA